MADNYPFEHCSLWTRTLGSPVARRARAPHEHHRTRLRQAFLQTRERIAALCSKIAHSLPEFTIHDITHIDALWEIASLIIGEEYPITPSEGYVLGCAFLLHDAGLSLAAYQFGIDEIKKDKLWSDTLGVQLKRQIGRFPTEDERKKASSDVIDATLRECLRELHAKKALTLAQTEYKHFNHDSSYYLIEDSDLRASYGQAIGEIAYSHWANLSDVADCFDRMHGAMPGLPSDWTVDPLKLACILRVTDACHIDSRRAPGFLRAITKPTGHSASHWRFQERILAPISNGGRIVFTSNIPFGVSDANAWWVGYDLIQVADTELRDVDSLLADKNKPRFSLRSVAGSRSTTQLSSLIQTTGWRPVNTELRANDVASLVRRLGGTTLYGERPIVPVRELIQNARDAIVARRKIESRGEHWGTIDVRIELIEGEEWLSVADTGIGMSAELLTGPLLDFGTSYWGSKLMMSEHPGLASTDFCPIGKFGIGFFSVFMLGTTVKVITRRLEDSRKRTHVLEFGGGIDSRPILREAAETEMLSESGTHVKVRLDVPSYEGLLSAGCLGSRFRDIDRKQPWALADFCEWLCPAVDVNLCVTDMSGATTLVATANDWIQLQPKELLERLGAGDENLENLISSHGGIGVDLADIFERNLRPIVNEDGTVVGRGLISPPSFGLKLGWYEIGSAVTDGPFRIETADNFFGIVTGISENAARDKFRVYASNSALASWATDQANHLQTIDKSPEHLSEAALFVRSYGGDIGSLPVAFGSSGWMNREQIRSAIQELESVVICPSTANDLFHLYWNWRGGREFNIVPGMFVVAEDSIAMSWNEQYQLLNHKATHFAWNWYSETLIGELLETIADAWCVPLQQLLENGEYSIAERQLSAKYLVLTEPPNDAEDDMVETSNVHVIFRPLV